MAYVYGARSLARLEGVHPDLVQVDKLAIQIATQDWSVFEGCRSADRQRELFESGASKIDGVRKKGRHQKGADGWCHATDLVPYVGGQLRWETNLCFAIAEAVRQVAVELAIPIRWGGTWQIITAKQYRDVPIVDLYKAKPSWDACHFELPRSNTYPD